jgi:uncharacterized Tic20 family protein
MSQGYGPPGPPGQPPHPYPPQAQNPYSYPYLYPAGQPPAPSGPTSDERSMAMLAHVLSIFSTFVAPLVIYFAKRKESRFVAFHALQALIWHVLFMAGWFVALIVFVFAVGFGQALLAPGARAHEQPSPEFFLGFFGIWAVLMLSWFANLGCTVYLTIRASSGRWSGYPIVGALVRRFGKFESGR